MNWLLLGFVGFLCIIWLAYTGVEWLRARRKPAPLVSNRVKLCRRTLGFDECWVVVGPDGRYLSWSGKPTGTTTDGACNVVAKFMKSPDASCFAEEHGWTVA